LIRPAPESLSALIEALSVRRLIVDVVVERSLAAYEAWEPDLHAFAWVDPNVVRTAAREADTIEADPGRPLHGVPVGIKDVFDTAGVPTEYGSLLFKGRIPSKDALAVARLVAAGAIVFGKTITAELAYFAPGPTTNPWNPRRTPGGSSMGSAAAVAAGIIPGSIGTQTNGSVIRPAAFCGVGGFKPTAGRLPTEGALRFSPSLDQVGTFAGDVVGSARLAAVIAGDAPADWVPEKSAAAPPALAVVRTPEWETAEPAARMDFDRCLDTLRADGAELSDLEVPTELGHALAVHRTIMAAEASRYIGPLVFSDRTLVSAQMLELLDEGAAVGQDDYREALRKRDSIREEFERWSAGFDAIITPPTSGEAPDIGTTGSPTFCTRWTLVGAPAITLPSGLGPNGLPLGLQLIGRTGLDSTLIGVARWVESALPPKQRPTGPRRHS
jgi:Asp-tRNA(Asn)/Glu-tRNA(Gln) amidotransferase A subunit family amidase